MKREEIKKIALKITDGFFSTATNTTLFTFFLVCESVGTPRSSYGVNLTFDTALDDLADFNYNTIKRSLVRLKHKGLINYKMKNLKKTLKITKQGKERLKDILPVYRLKRTWDGHIYLISYDIPEKRLNERKLLQDYLLKLGAKMLQKSFYIIPFNPAQILKEFAQEKDLEGTIIVSCIGKDGFIGEENLSSLIKHVYQIKQLEKRYKNFIEKYKNTKQVKTEIAFVFHSIVKDDPQLPFELLPKDWAGNKAFSLFKQFFPSKIHS